MRVLLVNTNRMKPAIGPIGLDYLADALLAAGHTIHLLDLCFVDDVAGAINRICGEFRPEIIGITIRNTDDCYFSGQAFFLPEIKTFIALLQQATGAPVVLGGNGFSVTPATVLDYCGAAFGIVGEGEAGFPTLLEALARGAGFSRVPNLIYRDGAVIRQNRIVPLDLASLPSRGRALADNARYFKEGGQAGFETKRGCPMACIYCADVVTKGQATRLLPPAKVVEELATLVGQGINCFHTCDSEFNVPVAHARAVCQAIVAAGLGERIRWYAYCAPAPFDEELAVLFKRAGGAGINFGADSGCDEILRRLGRQFTTAELARTAAICRQHQIPFMYDLLLGGPGETCETVTQTVDFMRRIEPDCVGLSLGVRIYDGTPIARAIRAEGDPASNPNLYGAKENNPHFLKPVFYFSPAVGERLPAYVQEQVRGDPRFFLPETSEQNSNYNYNDNQPLVCAIQNGARGAYWDILRRMKGR
jgi:radical SAM superfamily enzyme YgiQ (UPF0313 family)